MPENLVIECEITTGTVINWLASGMWKSKYFSRLQVSKEQEH